KTSIHLKKQIVGVVYQAINKKYVCSNHGSYSSNSGYLITKSKCLYDGDFIKYCNPFSVICLHLLKFNCSSFVNFIKCCNPLSVIGEHKQNHTKNIQPKILDK